MTLPIIAWALAIAITSALAGALVVMALMGAAHELHDDLSQDLVQRLTPRQIAAAALSDAVRRHDTRDQHTALLALRSATTAALRAEVGR